MRDKSHSRKKLRILHVGIQQDTLLTRNYARYGTRSQIRDYIQWLLGCKLLSRLPGIRRSMDTRHRQMVQ